VDVDFWRLPAGVDEVLPPQARRLEMLRRGVLDLFDSWGYDYVEPPMIEYLDALLVGNDLNLQTLKVADQSSGRTLGVRADITSQVARIDANSLGGDSTRRLCYAGATVRANPRGVFESRVPMKAGAEIYGCADVEADLEIMSMAIDAFSLAGVGQPVIELGHVDLVRQLVLGLDLPARLHERLMQAIRIKSEADIMQLLAAYPETAKLACRLVRLIGGVEVLDQAKELFAQEGAEFRQPIDVLTHCAAQLAQRRPEAQLRFDLSEPVGFGYHQALVFALYDRQHGRALARGGRYDGIGAQFGNARPATGFDMSLKSLIAVTAGTAADNNSAIWAPWPADEAQRVKQRAAVRALRKRGERVVQALCEGDLVDQSCDRAISTNVDASVDGGWCLVELA